MNREKKLVLKKFRVLNFFIISCLIAGIVFFGVFMVAFFVDPKYRELLIQVSFFGLPISILTGTILVAKGNKIIKEA